MNESLPSSGKRFEQTFLTNGGTFTSCMRSAKRFEVKMSDRTPMPPWNGVTIASARLKTPAHGTAESVRNDIAGILRRMPPRWQRDRGVLHIPSCRFIQKSIKKPKHRPKCMLLKMPSCSTSSK